MKNKKKTKVQEQYNQNTKLHYMTYQKDLSINSLLRLPILLISIGESTHMLKHTWKEEYK